MPTQPAILEELAVRYGGCDPASPDDVARFYERRFRKLSRRERDRISFEILRRDGEAIPAKPLTPAEVRHLDNLFEDEDGDLNRADTRPAVAAFRRLALGQAGFSLAVFGAVGSVRLLPDLFPGLGHHLLQVVEVVLIGVGLVGSGAALFFERRSPAGLGIVKDYRGKSE